jgi:hypothetical protein
LSETRLEIGGPFGTVELGCSLDRPWLITPKSTAKKTESE